MERAGAQKKGRTGGLSANGAIGTTVGQQFSWTIIPKIPFINPEPKVSLNAKTAAARSFSPAQIEIMKAVILHGPANGKGDLRFTSIDRSGENSWHGKRASIDLGRPLTMHWPPPTNYRLLWELWQNLIRSGFPGGVGLGHPDNAHVHIDFGRATPYYFLETSPTGRGKTYSIYEPGVTKYYSRYRVRYGADGLAKWWLDDGISKMQAQALEGLKKKAVKP